MRVAIDSTPLLNQRTGIGQYTYYLVQNLVDLGDELELVLFCTSLRKPVPLSEVIPKRSHIVYADYRLPARVVQKMWQMTGHPRIEYFTGKLDVFHATNFVAPPRKSGKLVLTIHDAGFARMPSEHPQATRAYTDVLPREIDRADKIIVVSNFTKDEVIELFDVPEEKIRVIYNGVASAFCSIKDREAVKKALNKYGITRDYLLFVGQLEARKNLGGLIDSFNLFKKKWKLEHKLVLVGAPGWKAQEILKKVVDYSLEEEIIHLGYVPDEDLPFLMNGASAFLYPSLYEGFGIPPLEAMACGVPVIASNLTSLPEVLGDAGVLVSPYDTNEIAQAMIKVLSNSALRKRLIEKGFQRAKSFTWRKTAEQTLELYKEIL